MPPDGPRSLAGAPRRRTAPRPPGTREGRATGERWRQLHWTARPWACCVGGLPVGCWERPGATWPMERTSWRRRFFTASSGWATNLSLDWTKARFSASYAVGSWLTTAECVNNAYPPAFDKYCRCVFARRCLYQILARIATIPTFVSVRGESRWFFL